jgi:hypothetical protein
VSLEVAVLFEVVDEVAHRLLGDLGTLGQVGQTRPVRVDVLEDGGMGGAKVVEASFSQVGTDASDDVLEGDAQKNPDVGVLVAGRAGDRSQVSA